jgi:hypothetical protein
MLNTRCKCCAASYRLREDIQLNCILSDRHMSVVQTLPATMYLLGTFTRGRVGLRGVTVVDNSNENDVMKVPMKQDAVGICSLPYAVWWEPARAVDRPVHSTRLVELGEHDLLQRSTSAQCKLVHKLADNEMQFQSHCTAEHFDARKLGEAFYFLGVESCSLKQI